MGENKRIAIIGVSSILLVAAIVGTVTYGAMKNGKDTDDQTVATSSKASHTLCQYTDYKDTCENSLAKAGDNKDPSHLAQVAFQAAIDSVKEVMANSSLLKTAATDERTSTAFEICKEVLDSSIDDLERSIEKIGAFDKGNFDVFVNDLTTWLSGAGTFQETCLDAFENTTGDTGEKMKEFMKTTTELTSNGLAIVTQLGKVLSGLQIPGFSRRLLHDEDEEGEGDYNHNDNLRDDDRQLGKVLSGSQIPGFSRRLLHDEDEEGEGDYNHNDNLRDDNRQRHLLQAHPSTLKPNAVVALDGSGQFKSIQAAVNTAPQKVNETFIILVKAGVYHEYVEIPKRVYNVMLIGEGPTKTRITGNKNYADGTGTFKTATVGSNKGKVKNKSKTFKTATFAVNGDNFIARDIGFENTAGAIKHQAVALRVSADRCIFYNCHIDGYQDTLYVHNHRQFYRDCTISGTIDFIFGDAAAVFQNCKLVVRKPLDNQACMVTAQGRKEPRGKGALVLQNCTITAEQAFLDTKPMPEAFLGRPWKEYSRTIVMQSFIDSIIVPQGWAPWAGTYALDTLSYAEYQNRGPGSNIAHRVQWKGMKKLSPAQAMSFTPGTYIEGHEWIEGTGLPYVPGMMKV